MAIGVRVYECANASTREKHYTCTDMYQIYINTTSKSASLHYMYFAIPTASVRLWVNSISVPPSFHIIFLARPACYTWVLYCSWDRSTLLAGFTFDQGLVRIEVANAPMLPLKTCCLAEPLPAPTKSCIRQSDTWSQSRLMMFWLAPCQCVVTLEWQRVSGDIEGLHEGCNERCLCMCIRTGKSS